MTSAITHDRPCLPVGETEITREKCPQCGYDESIRECITMRDNAARFIACPRCGCMEEIDGDTRRRHKGFGVYVLEVSRGIMKAGVFPRSIPDDKVPSLLAHLHSLNDAVRFVTRWNESESRLEVLYNFAA